MVSNNRLSHHLSKFTESSIDKITGTPMNEQDKPFDHTFTHNLIFQDGYRNGFEDGRRWQRKYEQSSTNLVSFSFILGITIGIIVKAVFMSG